MFLGPILAFLVKKFSGEVLKIDFENLRRNPITFKFGAIEAVGRRRAAGTVYFHAHSPKRLRIILPELD